MRNKDNFDGGLGASFGLEPVWGALIASAIGAGGSIGARVLTSPESKVHQWSDGVGLLLGFAASGAMLAYPGTREAGKYGFLSVAVTQGLMLIGRFLTGGGLGWVTAQHEQVHGVGMPSMQQMNGLGHAMAVNQPPRLAGHVAGPMADTGQPPVQMSGGAMNGFQMAGLYGSTITGS